MTQLIGVTGAGGQTAAYVIRELARRGIPARGLARSPQSQGAATDAGAREAAGVDLGDPDSLRRAVRGLATLVFIAPAFDGEEETHAAGALAAASAEGVEQFVYHSVLHANLPGVPHHLRKLHVEARVRASDQRWTIVQPTIYQQTLLGLIRGADAGTVRVPWNPDAPFHPVDLADVAEVVGQVVADPDAHAGASYELAGPQPLSVREMVERAGQATGQRLQVEELPSTQVPLPPALTRTEVAERMAMFAKYDRGYPCSPNVLRFLLGREPTSLEDTARREFNPGPG